MAKVLALASFLALSFPSPQPALAAPENPPAILRVGAAAVDITPRDFEIHPPRADGKGWKKGDPFFDTGVDRLFDFEEAGAFGADGKPGRAGVDDDGNGVVDDCSRAGCAEYLAKGSDDVRDPAHDNYDAKTNPQGTEGDGKFQFVHLAGFSPYYPAFVRNRVASGIHDAIWARSLAIEGSNGVTTVLVSTDLPGLAWKHINPVRRRLEKTFGIPYSNIIIASTHDHAAPDAAGYWVSVMKGHNRPYTDHLRELIFESASQAIRSMTPAWMKTVTTSHIACSDARTGAWKREPDCHLPTFSGAYQLPGGDEYDQPMLQKDKRDPIVRNTRIVAAQFGNLETGKTIGTFIDWNNHPDSLGGGNTLISSDYSHYLREMVEARLGGVAVYFTGTLGSQIGGAPAPWWTEKMERVPDHPTVDSGFDRIRGIGYEVGLEAATALLAAPRESGETIDVHVQTASLDTNIDNFLQVVATGPVWLDHVERPDRMHRNLGRCKGLYGCVRSDMSVLNIGELSLVTAPGEIDPAYLLGRDESTADYGKKGKWHFDAMPGWITWMKGTHKAAIGQANGYLSYLLHRQDNVGWWNTKHPNHYEELVTVSKNFGDQAGDLMMKMLGSDERFSRHGEKQRSPAGAASDWRPGELFERIDKSLREAEAGP